MTAKLEKKIDDLIASSRTLCIVELCDEYMKDEGCRLVCNKLSSLDTITTLDFRGNDIQQMGAQSIIELLSKNTNITTLKLEWNLIGLHNTVSILCDGLLSSSICHLDLRNNKIDSTGGQIISQMLMKNTVLFHLDLRWNNLGLIGGQHIEDALSRNDDNYTLTECLLSGNQIPVQILRSIDAHLTTNKQNQSELQCIQQGEEETSNPMKMNTIKDDEKENETIETLQEEINDLFGSKSCLTKENEEMKVTIAALESQVLDFSDKCEILRNENVGLNACKRTLDDKISDLSLELEENVASRKSEKERFESMKEKISSGHRMEVNKLREIKDGELSRLRESCDALHSEINDLKRGNNTLRSEMLENEIANERKYIEFETALHAECNATLSKKMNDFSQNISEIKKSRDDLESEMKKEKAKYCKIIEGIETEKTQYQSWLNDEQKAKANVETEKRSLSMQIQKFMNVITQKNQQIECLKIGLKETQKSIKTLQNEHELSMKRVLAQNNRQTLTLDKSLRQNEQRLTLSEHRNRNLQLRLNKIQDEEQRKMTAVSDAIKVLTNAFQITTNYNSYAHHVQKHNKEIVMNDANDADHEETIIEIIDDEDDDDAETYEFDAEMDYMTDHKTFNKNNK